MRMIHSHWVRPRRTASTAAAAVKARPSTYETCMAPLRRTRCYGCSGRLARGRGAQGPGGGRPPAASTAVRIVVDEREEVTGVAGHHPIAVEIGRGASLHPRPVVDEGSVVRGGYHAVAVVV